MCRSWTNHWSKFKSPLRVVVQTLIRSRAAAAEKRERSKRERDEAKRLLARQQAELERQRREIEELKRQVRKLEAEKRDLETAPARVPDDPPLPNHGYGPRLISLAVNLARAVGLRGAERTMRILFDWLGIPWKIPDFTSIRGWMQRLGIAALEAPVDKADDWVWLADHSNQIGPEKVLVVLGVRASRLPPPGTPLKHTDVRLLAARPGTSWKREDVAKVYDELAERHGPPRSVVTDGAVELRESAECLKTRRSDTIALPDFKHKAANLLEQQLARDPRFAEFDTLLGRTRSAIQQTELAHLTPPGRKRKARFMNLDRYLDWGATMLWLLEHPHAESRRWTTPERLEEKLGWLRSFADDLAGWRECRQLIGAGLTLINERGLFRGAARRLRTTAAGLTHAVSRRLAAQLLRFVRDAERQLKPAERLPMSTEILESSFGLYKQLERQHSKGGFTSLLPAFGALLAPATPETVRAAFAKVSVKDAREWVRHNLGDTLTIKRQRTYREYRNHTQSATKPATAT